MSMYTCRPYNKHFKKTLALILLIFKHHKRGFLQNNGIYTKNRNFRGFHGNMPQFAYPASDFRPTTMVCEHIRFKSI